MVDIKREDITLQDWTKGISADEFAGGSYFYSEGISSGYSTKGFELGYRLSKSSLNSRTQGYATAIVPTNNYGFLCFTRDGRIETEETWNGASTGSGDSNGGGAIYAFAPGSLNNGYLNGVLYGNYAIGIKQTGIDVIDYENAFDPTAEILTNTSLTSSTGWTIGIGWTIGTSGATHSSGTSAITTDISGAGLNADNYCRCAIKIVDWTAGKINVTIGNTTETFDTGADGWYVANLRGKSAGSTALTITPSSNFNGTIRYVNLHEFDVTNSVRTNKASISGGAGSSYHPALIWEGDLYIASLNRVTIVNLSDWGTDSKKLIDSNFEIVSMTQQAGNIIIWATDGFDSRQYYWNGVDSVASEVIEWKGLIIKAVTGTEIVSYVLTTSGQSVGSVEGYEYRLYAVQGYQRNLIASKLYQSLSSSYLNTEHYNINKKFDFNDVSDFHGMSIFLDGLYMAGCDGLYKYGTDIPGLGNSWTRPVKYDTGATEIVLGQRGHFLGIGLRVDGINYIANVDNRLYTSNGFVVTESIYRDKIGTRKALEKLKIGYKNVASTVGNIKLYAIVDDTYFWRFRPTSTPTVRPSVGDVYNVANGTTAKVIDVDTTEGVITFVTVSDTGSRMGKANTSLTKVSGDGDSTIAVGYNYDNMCLIKTIENSNQGYGSDLVFGKDFVSTYMPYRYKIQFVIELNSNSRYLSPEIYELSINSDITDITL